MELIDLQSSSILKNKSYEKTITEFYAFLNQVLFKNILDNVEIFGILGSTYICKTIFSLFKITKSKNRSQIKDDNLEAVLRIAISGFSSAAF